MSLSRSLRCIACDFAARISEFQQFYLFEDRRRLSVFTELGFCLACDGYEVIERLPEQPEL